MKKSLMAHLIFMMLATIGCGGGSNSSTTSASPVLTQDTLAGVVPAPVGGVRQAASVLFNVGSPGGTVTVTLTSATENRPDGSANPSVVMGIAVGSPSGASCTLAAGNVPILLQAGANSTISGSASAGLYCVQVSDVTNQLGPVAFAVVVAHP